MRLSRFELLLLAALILLLALTVLLFWLSDPTGFALFFAWPAGGVWSNLAASLLLGVPAVYAILRKLTRNHTEHLSILHRHHREVLAALKESQT